MRRGGRVAVVATVLALAAVPAIGVPLLAAAEQTRVVVTAASDATVSQVTQDGDTAATSTLTTCPALCENNPRGRRDATVTFEVAGLPRRAAGIRAQLRLYSWQRYPATTTVRSGADGSGEVLATATSVANGYNTWDVSGAVTGNGAYTFSVQQDGYPARVYWASRENQNAGARPQLELSYRTGGSAAIPPSPSPPSSPSPSPSSSSSPAESPASSSSSPAESPAAPWKLTWQDNFDGSALDPGAWVAKNDTSVDYDRACITSDPGNVFVGDGLLTLRAQRQQATCGRQTRDYTTSYLTTEGHKSFRYGRFEIRAKSPTGPDDSTGLWPAFWLRPDDAGKGEIDVVELPGGAQYSSAATQSIFYDYTPVKQDNRAPLPAGHPADGFHTYATEWEPGVLRWYLDGVLVWQRDRTTTPWFDEVFAKPYHLRINFQVGGWPGEPDAATRFPADFQVDYVRVWQRSGPA